MKQPSVRLSVCLSVCPIIRPPHAAAAGLLLWARLIDCCMAWRRSTRTPPLYIHSKGRWNGFGIKKLVDTEGTVGLLTADCKS